MARCLERSTLCSLCSHMLCSRLKAARVHLTITTHFPRMGNKPARPVHKMRVPGSKVVVMDEMTHTWPSGPSCPKDDDRLSGASRGISLRIATSDLAFKRGVPGTIRPDSTDDSSADDVACSDLRLLYHLSLTRGIESPQSTRAESLPLGRCGRGSRSRMQPRTVCSGAGP